MTQTEKRNYLINYLLSERNESAELPKDEYSQKRLLRSLFNVRMPKSVTDDFLQIQDAYLQEENRRKGTTDIAELEPIQSSETDERSDPLPAIEIVPDHTASEGLTLELKVTENQKPDSGDLEPVSNLGPVLNPEPDSRPNPVPDENKQKKKRRSGKVPLRYRSSVLERLHKYQMKLAKERRKKER